ncbi:MAG TPA: TolC family protein [Bryobacteraceae bacterium]|nr:TolC family protein [Bryobacteraceae bacterium]
MTARNALRSALASVCAASTLAAQQSIDPVRPNTTVLLRPYEAPYVPPARLQNSVRARTLIRAGVLYLTVHDALALALDNNIDLENARYGPISAQWQLERSQAGGALPGVPSAASQVGAVASGQGVAGSQAAAGVTTGFAGVSGGNAGQATISQIGPIVQVLDPNITETSLWSHQSVPQPNATQSITPVLLTGTHSYSGSYNQGFLVGGNVSVTYSDSFLKENAASDLLNPSSAPSLAINWQQNLLQGFGIAVNERTINVSRLNVKASALNFETQAINTVTTVLNNYYGLVADYEDLRAKREALDLAERLDREARIRFENGTMATLDVTTADSALASAQSDLTVSATTLQQQELQLKNMLSRTGLMDPVFAEARIVPVDHMVIPAEYNLPPLDQMVKTALEKRPDLASERLGVTSAEISALGTKNGVLPVLSASATASAAGLSGVPKTAVTHTGTRSANLYFSGDVGRGLQEVFQHDFPTYSLFTHFQVYAHNRQATADQAIDQLSLRQTQIGLDRDLNSVSVSVSNYAIAIRQALARYRAGAQNRILEQQLLDAEEKKLANGLSTASLVIQQQRDLATAQSTEIAAEVAYSNAKIALDQTLGTTLDVNHVSLDDARKGALPETPAPAPVH